MVKSISQTEFDDNFNSLNDLLKSQKKRDGKMEELLNQFASRHKTHASYCVTQIPGNLGRHDNSISDSKYESTLVYLNDGKKMAMAYANILFS